MTTEPTTVGDLRASQRGQRIEIEHDGVTIAGPLTDLRVEQEWIREVSMADDPTVDRRIPGRVAITLSIGRWLSPVLPPSTPVTLLTPLDQR